MKKRSDIDLQGLKTTDHLSHVDRSDEIDVRASCKSRGIVSGLELRDWLALEDWLASKDEINISKMADR